MLLNCMKKMNKNKKKQPKNQEKNKKRKDHEDIKSFFIFNIKVIKNEK